MSNNTPKVCKIEKCTNIGSYDRKRNAVYLKKGMCNTHYLRERKHGTPHIQSVHDRRPAIIEGDIAKIPLGLNAKDGYATIDAEDAHLSSRNFYKGANGYASSDTPTRSSLHHLVAGKPDKGYFVDHINRDRLDNRKANLRVVTVKQSSYNTSPVRGAASHHKGVWFSSQKQKWVAEIKVNNVKKHLGTFADENEAARAYNDAAIKHFGEYAYINSVPNLL